MKIKGCKGCHWESHCGCGERCDYYDPLYESDQIMVAEYKAELYRRARAYREIEGKSRDEEY